jgi:2-C-methyl-D-erythritol 4-phosphate cytidylyltransferase
MAQRSGGSAEVGATWVLIAAAGSGERLGIDRPKAFAVLGERPLLAESLDRLERCELVDAIVVAAPAGWEEPSILLAEELAASKVVACVTGGATRAESVAAALAEVDEQALVVIVHDAARPLVDEALLERLLVPLAEGFDGAVPVLPVADTLKRVRDGVVVGRHRRFSHRSCGRPSRAISGARRTARRSSSASEEGSLSSTATRSC